MFRCKITALLFHRLYHQDTDACSTCERLVLTEQLECVSGNAHHLFVRLLCIAPDQCTVKKSKK